MADTGEHLIDAVVEANEGVERAREQARLIVEQAVARRAAAIDAARAGGVPLTHVAARLGVSYQRLQTLLRTRPQNPR